MFYHFSRSTIVPKHLPSKLEWQRVYNNFRLLRCNTSDNKRKRLNDISNINESLNNDNINLQNIEKSSFRNMIGDYFNSTEATLLFCPQDDESVEDCLSRRIDLFDDILNNKIDVSFIVKRACEENCELNIKQTIQIRQRIQYLRMAYFNVLESDQDQPVMFKFCCKKSNKING